MSTTQHRVYTPDPEVVEVRELTDEADDDGLFRIRMPVTSTAEARDGMAFDRNRVEGFREQIEGGRVPVFLDHGRNEQTGSRYSALGKVGYLDAPGLSERNGATDLDADFVLVDPAELNEDVGAIREALSWLRQQAEAGLPIASSVGWAEDTGDRELPGDADLLETSIVGIPSDARTTTASVDEATLARAVDAAAEGFDIRAFLDELSGGGTLPETDPAHDGSEMAAVHAGDGWERDINDPAFAPGDAVMWTWQGESVHGRVDDIHEQYTPPAADEPITGEDGEAVYSIFEWDEETKTFQSSPDQPNVAKSESSLEASQMDLPPASEDNFRGAGEDTMTNDETTSTGDDAGTTDEQNRMTDEEFRESMMEMQEQQTELLRDLVNRMDGEDGDDADEDEDEENAADADDAEGGDRTVTLDGEERAVDEALEELREQAAEAEPAEPETTDRGEAADSADEDDADEPGFGFAGAGE